MLIENVGNGDQEDWKKGGREEVFWGMGLLAEFIDKKKL